MRPAQQEMAASGRIKREGGGGRDKGGGRDSSKSGYWFYSLIALIIAVVIGGWISLKQNAKAELNVAEDVSAATFSQVKDRDRGLNNDM